GILGIFLGAAFLIATCLHWKRCDKIQGGFQVEEVPAGEIGSEMRLPRMRSIPNCPSPALLVPAPHHFNDLKKRKLRSKRMRPARSQIKVEYPLSRKSALTKTAARA